MLALNTAFHKALHYIVYCAAAFKSTAAHNSNRFLYCTLHIGVRWVALLYFVSVCDGTQNVKRYRHRYFFRYQIFSIPIPVLFLVQNFPDTCSETPDCCIALHNAQWGTLDCYAILCVELFSIAFHYTFSS